MKKTTLALTMFSILFFQNAIAQPVGNKNTSPSQGESTECMQQFKACTDAWNSVSTTKNYQACKEVCHKAMLKCKTTRFIDKEKKDTSFDRAKRHRLDCANRLQKTLKGK